MHDEDDFHYDDEYHHYDDDYDYVIFADQHHLQTITIVFIYCNLVRFLKQD